MSERDIFIAALEIEEPAERAAYLGRACAGDADLLRRVGGLLGAHGRAGQFLDRPAVEQLAAQGGLSEDPTQLGSRLAGEVERTPDAPSERTQAEPPHDEDDLPLDFLTPSQRADSLGRLGHYEVLELVGRGGMGVVLRAFDETLHRVVAIKVMAPQLATSATARRRFLREARAAAAVSHDNVVTIHAVEEGEGVPYLVMQFVAGMSLQDKLDRQGPPELREMLRIGMQAAAGLAAAHAHGIVHRDVKPANILLENGVERVKISDFGLARAIDDASLTQSGLIAGTPMYMSPEQAEGRPADHRSDLFSLGSVLYALCTGRPPFRADTTTAVLRRVCEDTPRSIREANPDTPVWLCDIIGRLHAKNPSDRFQTAAEVAELLGGHLARLQRPDASGLEAEAEEAPKPREDDRAAANAHAPARRRKRWPAAAAALLLLLTGLGLTEATGITHITGTVIRIFTPEGTLVVEVDDPAVRVTIDGEDIVIHGAGPQEVRLKAGIYKLKATKDGAPVKLSTELVTISRGGKQVVRVSHEPAVAKDDPGKAKDTAFIPLDTVQAPGETVALAFAPDEKTLAIGLRDGRVLLWDVPGKRERKVWQGHKLPICSLAFSPKGDKLLSGAGDWKKPGTPGEVKVWDSATGKEDRSLPWEAGPVFAVAWAPGIQAVAAAGQNGRVRVWHPETGQEHNPRWAHTGSVLDLAFSPDGCLASASSDRTIRLWELASGKMAGILQGHENEVNCVRFSTDGMTLASGSRDRTIKLWNRQTLKEQATIEGHADWVHSLAFSGGGGILFGGDVNQQVKAWQVSTQKHLADLSTPGSQTGGIITLAPKSRLLATAHHIGTIRLWDVSSLVAGELTDKPESPRPFVILTGKGTAERTFATLAEAVLGASDGDTIEVRGDGPFVTGPVTMNQKALIIRAAEGCRPVIRMSPEGLLGNSPLLTASGSLVLEGLELQRVGGASHEKDPTLLHVVSVKGASVRLAHCRLLLHRNEGPQFALHCVQASEAPVCELRNCEVLAGGTAVGLSYAPLSSEVVLENCLVAGIGHGVLIANRATVRQLSITLHKNTFLIGHGLGWNPVFGAEAEPKDLKPKVFHIDARENVFTSGLHFNQPDVPGKKLSPQEAEALLQRVFEWREQRNLYPEGLELLWLTGNWKRLPEARELKTLTEWRQFWKLPATGSVQGPVQLARISHQHFETRPLLEA